MGSQWLSYYILQCVCVCSVCVCVRVCVVCVCVYHVLCVIMCVCMCVCVCELYHMTAVMGSQWLSYYIRQCVCVCSVCVVCVCVCVVCVCVYHVLCVIVCVCMCVCVWKTSINSRITTSLHWSVQFTRNLQKRHMYYTSYTGPPSPLRELCPSTPIPSARDVLLSSL